MTDLRRSVTVSDARLHQKQQQHQTYRDGFRLSSNLTPEPKPHATGTSGAALTNGHGRNPLLQSLTQHASLGSIGSGGSTTSSTATTTATATTIGNQCNGGVGALAEIQFDEREIYYVSPSKRKGSFCAADGVVQPLRSSFRACERLRSTVAASVAPSYPALIPSAAYGMRTAGEGHDLSFDSYEISSHYSDTAMQGLRSGGYSSGVGEMVGGGNLVTTVATGSSSSNSSLLAQQHSMPSHRSQNNVTFSNYVSEQCAPAGTTPQQNRGSLRRSKGRSNQSLCSCDAGTEMEINPDPARPLYQYSLERRHKGHTYTCEQNAQILMRLERERNRKFSLTGGGGESDGKDEVQSDTPSSSDMDAIPPVPPPPSMKRNGSMRSLRLLQQHHQQKRPTPNSNSIANSKAISTLCNGGGGSMSNDCVNSGLDVGSVIDDCTTSILKCANAVGAEIIAAAKTNGTYKAGSIATLATMASQHTKPDVCRVGNAITSLSNFPPSTASFSTDDIFMPNSKKTDPSMCFLHGLGHNTALGANLAHAQSNRRSTLSLSKYNTIGPSSEYARQLSLYSQQLQQQQQRNAATRCRCFSQSLSNFSRDYFGQHQRSLRRNDDDSDNHAKHHSIFHTVGDEHEWNDRSPPSLPVNSRSYSNLVDIDGRQSVLSNNRLHYHNYPHHTALDDDAAANVFSSSCSYGNLLNNVSSFTNLSSANNGLKEKLQQLQHHHHHEHHLHSHQPTTHQHHLQQHHSHQQHQAAAAASQQMSQKHHQLHSSITSIMPWKHRQCPSRGSSSSGTNSFRFDAAKHWLAVSSILLIIGAASVAVPLALRVAASAPFEERLRVAVQLLDQVPLIDGHNDLPWNIRKFLHNKLNDFKFDEDLRNVMPWERSHWSHTDLQRLKKGRISAQFWAAYVPCEAQHRDAVQLTLEQIDVIKRLTDRYSPQLTTCTSSEDIIEAHKNQQLCSLTGVEGGHSLGGSLAVLRTLYAIGVRYMTLTSTCHTPWADSSYADAPTFNVKHGGLTIFGKTIIREMNRLGMMVDLSHVSTGTMRDALEVSEAPVIFSHSSAYELCNSSRNVQDDMLQSLAKNGGLVMVNFYSKFLSCSDNSTVHDAVAHINHIKRIAGIDHVGLGAGYDGINFTPKGLEDVSSYPTLFAELLGVGWSMEDLTKLAGGNFLRVMQQVERIRDEKKVAGVKPYEDHPNFRTDDPYNCTSS